RAGKPVPVITAEVSESIEELIKRRILAQDFNDIIRRRPDDLATGAGGRRGRQDFELEDSRSKKGLAEEYEEEHLRRNDANFVEEKDEKAKKEHAEIEALWKDISGKLNTLSSMHFRPKPAAAQLDVRVDAPTITMEDARPNTGGEVASASRLAPQEVYVPGENKSSTGKTEVVTRAGLPVGREEMGKDERKRRRRREKERIRKAEGNKPAKVGEAGKGGKGGVGEKKEVVERLRKGGVRVIGKKGALTDVEGKAVADLGSRQGGAAFKL
ncbi:U3 snoRNP protein, partial [Elasticomyces elasticus]